MSGLKTQASELKFRVKLLSGLAGLGAVSSAVLYLGWFTSWQADLPTLLRLLPVVAPSRTFQAVIAIGAFLLFWVGVGIIWKPWRSDDDAPDQRRTIKKPWEK